MNIFNSIKIKKPRSNKFDLSHERKLSMNMGELVPIMLEEVVPGDRFKSSSEVFIRMAPMLAPIMHRVNVYTHFFFVPNRIIWDDWKDFITGGEDGLDNTVFPKIRVTNGNRALFQKGSLADYLGLPIPDQTISLQGSNEISALPFRAYAEVYNEYYRDQNLIAKIPYSKGAHDPLDEPELLELRIRAWEKDYFTSALPWPQRGADVQLPVNFNYKTTSTAEQQDGTPASGAISAVLGTLQDGTAPIKIENLEDNATSVTINELRNATRLQEWLEKNARAGSRYIEQILSHFGVRSSDARLQRPEYLGGGKSPVIISEVLNQAGQGSGATPPDLAPVGQQYGHGVAVGKSNTFQKSFEEHGYVIGIMSVLPRTAYQQGIERTWTKFDKLDYYWPEFAHLGEQEIKQQEIFWDGTYLNAETTTFGYIPRYSEYKYKQSSVHGEFRQTGVDESNVNLSFWHMSRYFDRLTPPALNEEFVTSDPTQNIFAATDKVIDKLYVQVYNKVSAIRPMPYYGTPYL